MSKKGLLVICLVSLIFSLALAAQPAGAVYPPYQIHVDSKDAYSIHYSVPNAPGSPTDYWLQQVPEGGFPQGIQGDVKCAGGILAWVAEYTIPSGPVYEIHYIVYDPAHGGWQHQTEVFDLGDSRSCWTINGWFNVQDGVVTYLNESVMNNNNNSFARVHWLNFATYDPVLGQWVLQKRNFAFQDGVMYGCRWLTVKDGVVAWAVGGIHPSDFDLWGWISSLVKLAFDVAAAIYVAPVGIVAIAGTEYGQIFAATVKYFLVTLPSVAIEENAFLAKTWQMITKNGKDVKYPATFESARQDVIVYYSIYDATAAQPGWRSGACQVPYGQELGPPPIDIVDATVNINAGYYAFDENDLLTWYPKSTQQGYANGFWSDGTTEPKAYFYVAQPGGGQVPSEVQFWDMSIGSAFLTRNWTFPDGTTSPLTSPTVTFRHATPGAAQLDICWTSPFQIPLIVSSASRPVILYDMPPTGAFQILSLSGSSSYTNSRDITLIGYYSDVTTDMALGCSNGTAPVVWGPWQPVAHPLGGNNIFNQFYHLPAGDGPKTVWVSYRNSATGDVTTYSASVVLDATPPTGRMTINGGAALTASTNVNLDLFASDTGSSVSEMKVWDDHTIIVPGLNYWQPYNTQLQWTFTTADTGTRTVYAQFKDGVGNISSPPVSATITLDPVNPPSSFQASMSANGVPLNFSNYLNGYLEQVTLQISAIFRYPMSQMQLGNAKQDRSGNWTVNWGAWEPYSTTRQWNFLGQYNAVFANFKDSSGTIYGPIKFGYLEDTTPPTDGTLAATAKLTMTTMLKWSGFADNQSGINRYELYYSPFGFPDRNTGTLVYKGFQTRASQSGLTPGSTCYYRLYAVDNVGNYSNGVTLQTKTQPLPRPLPFLNLLLD
jgi:hypothetical protein